MRNLVGFSARLDSMATATAVGFDKIAPRATGAPCGLHADDALYILCAWTFAWRAEAAGHAAIAVVNFLPRHFKHRHRRHCRGRAYTCCSAARVTSSVHFDDTCV